MKRRTSSHGSSVGGRPSSDCSTMATGPPDVMVTNQEPADATEECPGKKKSKFQTFKNFFAKKKRKEAATPVGDSGLKSSLSSDNVNTPEPTLIRSEKDKGSGSKMNMGSKALSHDSVFVSDLPASEGNQGLGASQDSIQGKVKSLQLQLKQAIRLGSPPSLMCMKKGDDAGTLSEDDGLPCSPPEYSTLHTVLAGGSHRSSKLVQRNSSLSLEGTDSDEDQMSYEAGSRSVSPLVHLPVDFSQAASPIGCLDSTAARHRLAVRHKACTKRKPASRIECMTEGESFQEERLSVAIPEADEEDVEDEQTGVSVEDVEEWTDGLHSQHAQSDQQMSSPDREDEQGAEQEASHGLDVCSVSASSPSPQRDDSDSEECFSVESPALQFQTKTTPLGSLDSLEPPTGDFLLDAGCAEPEEASSLLQEVLSSLKGPLTSTMGLEADAVMQVMDEAVSDANSEVDELVDEPEPLLPPSDHLAPPTDHMAPPSDTHLPQDVSFPSERPPSLAVCPVEVDSETDEVVVEEEQFLSKEANEEDAEENRHEHLAKEEEHMPSVYMKQEEENVGESEEEGEEEKEEEMEEVEEVEAKAMEEKEEEVEEAEEVVEEEGEEEREDKREKEEEEYIEAVPEVPVQTVILESEDGEDVEPKSVDDTKQAPESDTDSERGFESPECPSSPELYEQAVMDQAVMDQELMDQAGASQLPNRSPLEDSMDQPEALTKNEEEEPSITADQSSPTPSASPSLELSSQEQPCSRPNTPEDAGKQPSATEQGRARFTIAPAWQRSLSGGANTKDPSSPSPSSSPSPFSSSTFSSISPSVSVPGAADGGSTTKRDPPSRVEPTNLVRAEVPASPSRTQSTVSSPLLPPKDAPPAQEKGKPESPFGVRLRKTPVLLRYGSESDTPGVTTPAQPVEQQKSLSTEPLQPPLPLSKPALPKKPELQGDGSVKPKRAPDPAVSRVPSGGSESPSWISMARQKQRIFKENSLDESLEKNTPAEKEPQRKSSLPTLLSPVNKDHPKPPGSPVKVPCSLEISKPAVVKEEGRRALAHPSPAALPQDEPPWMALAKKKAKAWSEMPQIVQ